VHHQDHNYWQFGGLCKRHVSSSNEPSSRVK
jgi:hypothetical protein